MTAFQPVVYAVDPRVMLVHGESLSVLRGFSDCYFDALVTDPPAGISFMPGTNKWDSDKGGRLAWVAWLAEIMAEVHRVLKPGAYGLVWAHSKTSHWTACALEDAGLVIRECIFHLHAQGGAKCLNVAKAIDEQLGVAPTIVGQKPWSTHDIRGGRSVGGGRERLHLPEEAPTSPEARAWDGWYSGVKPMVECWWLVQRPIAETNIAQNVLRWGVGALNIGATEVTRAPEDRPGWHESGSYGRDGYLGTSTFRIRDMTAEEVQARRNGKGRHTPNLLLSHHELCQRVGTQRVKGCPLTVIQGGKDGGGYDVGVSDGTRRSVFEGYGDEEGMETVDLWACVPGCPVRSLDIQGARGKKKEQATSRYYPNFAEPWYFAPKPGRSEKEAGLEHLEAATLHRVNPGGLEREKRYAPTEVKNNHSTVKGLTLCDWLCRLVTPPGGAVLDPFLGSGSIGCSAVRSGFQFVGIEQGEPVGDDRYLRIAEGRIHHWLRESDR